MERWHKVGVSTDHDEAVTEILVGIVHEMDGDIDVGALLFRYGEEPRAPMGAGRHLARMFFPSNRP